MNGLKDHCHCEHAKETHHEGRFNCLASRCDCRAYKLYSDPYEEDPTPTERRFPVVAPLMDPYDGYDDGTPITWPMFPAAKP